MYVLICEVLSKRQSGNFTVYVAGGREKSEI